MTILPWLFFLIFLHVFFLDIANVYTLYWSNVHSFRKYKNSEKMTKRIEEMYVSGDNNITTQKLFRPGVPSEPNIV